MALKQSFLILDWHSWDYNRKSIIFLAPCGKYIPKSGQCLHLPISLYKDYQFRDLVLKVFAISVYILSCNIVCIAQSFLYLPAEYRWLFFNIFGVQNSGNNRREHNLKSCFVDRPMKPYRLYIFGIYPEHWRIAKQCECYCAMKPSGKLLHDLN